MSEPLKDFRGKVTSLTDAVLEAQNRATGKDKSEIAREVLHAWALEQVRAARLIVQWAHDEGMAGESRGAAGEATGADPMSSASEKVTPRAGTDYRRMTRE